jgi:hypothetical protein
MRSFFLADATTTPGTADSTNPLKHLNNAGGAAGYQVGQGAEAGLINVISIVINTALGLLGVIFLTLLVYAGYIWMTAGGDESKVEKSKQTIGHALIGLLIVLCAYAIANFVVPQVYCISNPDAPTCGV